ncbi:MAG TPA: DUF6531 domain-containing protein, partial [Candidatus Binataceae bacterium]
MKPHTLRMSCAFALSLAVATLLGTRATALASCNPDVSLSGCAVTGGVTPASINPAPGESLTAMGAGLFEYSKTDLTIVAPIPINVTRTYRSYDKDVNNNIVYGAFGIGTTLNYDIYLYSATEVANGQFNSASVVMPDGAQIACANTDPACTTNSCPITSNTDFVCNTQPVGIWFNSHITYDATVPNGGGWDLTRKDGTVYKFGYGAPLQSINDRYNNSLTMTRAGTGGT